MRFEIDNKYLLHTTELYIYIYTPHAYTLVKKKGEREKKESLATLPQEEIENLNRIISFERIQVPFPCSRFTKNFPY